MRLGDAAVGERLVLADGPWRGNRVVRLPDVCEGAWPRVEPVGFLTLPGAGRSLRAALGVDPETVVYVETRRRS